MSSGQRSLPAFTVLSLYSDQDKPKWNGNSHFYERRRRGCFVKWFRLRRQDPYGFNDDRRGSTYQTLQCRSVSTSRKGHDPRRHLPQTRFSMLKTAKKEASSVRSNITQWKISQALWRIANPPTSKFSKVKDMLRPQTEHTIMQTETTLPTMSIWPRGHSNILVTLTIKAYVQGRLP